MNVMGNILLAILLTVFTAGVLAAEFRIEDEPPPGNLRLLKTISAQTEVFVYITGELENQDSFKLGDMFLRVKSNSGEWWVHTPAPFSEIDALGFVEGPNLLIGLRAAAGATTSVMNTQNRESY